MLSRLDTEVRGGVVNSHTAEAAAVQAGSSVASEAAPGTAVSADAGARLDVSDLRAIEESGLHEAVTTAERAYEEVSLDGEGLAIRIYLKAISAALG